MKKFGIIFFAFLLLLLSCEQPQPWPNRPEPCSDITYFQLSTAEYDRIYRSMFSPSPIGPFFYFVEDFTFANPVFNPNNPYEMAYIREDENKSGIEDEIWTFNFCTGRAQKLADNFYYNLDWGTNGWLLYTGTGHQIFKIKANGDSLTQLTNKSGYNRAGKWNPSGNLFSNDRSSGAEIANVDGLVVKKITTNPFGPIDWMDDTTLFGWRTNNFYSLSLNSETLTRLNSSWTCSTCPYALDQSTRACYLSQTHAPQLLLKYHLDGSNRVDTVLHTAISYQLYAGDYQPETDKLVFGLSRQFWKDSILNQRYLHRDILIMNGDGSGQRIVNLE
ncbi:MAG: hypothetical protein H6581_06245 [Bacteroidia bacterium]|nr:hypothetical protein [Bacteroidia bacterium]